MQCNSYCLTYLLTYPYSCWSRRWTQGLSTRHLSKLLLHPLLSLIILFIFNWPLLCCFLLASWSFTLQCASESCLIDTWTLHSQNALIIGSNFVLLCLFMLVDYVILSMLLFDILFGRKSLQICKKQLWWKLGGGVLPASVTLEHSLLYCRTDFTVLL